MPLDIMRSPSSANSGAKSKKYFGDFREDLKRILLELEALIELDLRALFLIDSVFVGNNDIRIRVRDESIGLDKIVSVVFRYHHTDEKYGHVHIEITAHEHSEEAKSHFLGKFLVTDRKKIKEKVLHGLTLGIRSI